MGAKYHNCNHNCFMYVFLSQVMKTIPVGITYASFAGLTIIATTTVGTFKFNQIPDLYTLIGLGLIVAGVLMVNLMGKLLVN